MFAPYKIANCQKACDLNSKILRMIAIQVI